MCRSSDVGVRLNVGFGFVIRAISRMSAFGAIWTFVREGTAEKGHFRPRRGGLKTQQFSVATEQVPILGNPASLHIDRVQLFLLRRTELVSVYDQLKRLPLHYTQHTCIVALKRMRHPNLFRSKPEQKTNDRSGREMDIAALHRFPPIRTTMRVL
jgi:hypothetical protein